MPPSPALDGCGMLPPEEVFMTISTQLSARTKTAQATMKAKAWTVEAAAELYELPFNELLYRAQEVHR